MALLSDGTAWAWGDNRWGQQGDGTLQFNDKPKPIPGAEHVRSIFVGIGTNGVIKDDGTVWIWGETIEDYVNNSPPSPSTVPQQVTIDNVKQILYFGGEAFVLKNDGTVWAWGYNSDGRLGIGNTTTMSDPIKIGLPPIKEIASSDAHTLALDYSGNLWAWGHNELGELGDGTTTNRLRPVPVDISNVVSIAAGGSNSYALKADGTVWMWGQYVLPPGTIINNLPTMGGFVEQPKPTYANLSDVTTICAGERHLLAIKTDGSLWALGYNYDGELGQGYESGVQYTPVKVPGFDKVKAISAGGSNSFALKDDGTIWGWGDNNFGAVGKVKLISDHGLSFYESVIKPTELKIDLSLTQPTHVVNVSQNVTIVPVVNTSSATPTSAPVASVTQSITPDTLVSANPTPGFSFITITLLGCLLISASLIFGFKWRKDR